MTCHGEPEHTDHALDDRLPAAEAKEVVRHLIRGCSRCQAAFQRSRVVPSREVPPELSAAYDAALNRAEDFALRIAPLPPCERKRFHKALALLKSGEGVEALTRTDMLVEGLGAYEALLTRSWAIRYDNPREMCHLARVAVEVAEDLDLDTHGAKAVADYQARAWGELANAYRVADRLREAEQAFGTAYSLATRGSGDRRLLMRLLNLEASLLGTLRDFGLALERLSALTDLYREAEEAHLAGRTLITKALYTYYSGKPEKASKITEEGLALIEKDREPALEVVAAMNRLLFLAECGHFRRAKRVLFEQRAKFKHIDRILKVKLRGIQGRISYGLGELESAEIAFREVQKGFKDAGLYFGGALAGLDLAMTLIRRKRMDEAVEEILASVMTFRSLNIHREILGSVILLEEVCRSQQMTLPLLEATVRFIRRKQIEHGPGLP